MKGRKLTFNKSENELIKKLRAKYEEMFLFGELEENCKKFQVDERDLKHFLYSDYIHYFRRLSITNIIKLSNLFDIPYEEFVDYNAYIESTRNKTREEIEEEQKMLKQYLVGKEWEEKIIKYYNDRGYFTYKIPTMNSGTVFDVIAVRKGAALMIECKNVDGDKLYYASSGLFKKRDELNHFVDTTGNNIYIYVNSKETGTWWTTWLKARPILESKGYIEKSDCFECDLDNKPKENEENENETDIT